jgi:hypothetical protein
MYRMRAHQDRIEDACSLVVVLLLGVSSSLGSLGVLLSSSLHSSRPGSSEGRGGREVDVLLRVESDDERGDVDDLLADSDVPLSDEDSSVVDRLGESRLEDLSLESSLHEVLGLEGKHVIESHSGLVKHTDSHKSSDERVSLEESLGVLGLELEELSGSSSDLGEGQLNSPDLSLVPESVLSGELELGVESGRLERPSGDLVGLAMIPRG